MSGLSFKAVVFDLDGVITKTALVHAAAWKAVFDEYLKSREAAGVGAFREFTHEGDYLPYVDGKPRYEGVQSFLLSRGIDIAFGDPEDMPDKETVCGIGNRKNMKFLEILKTNGVEVYPSTIKLIEELRDKGIGIGVASSSKNCKYVLKSAGIEFLFQTRVDGEVSAEMGLKGKPEGDIFVVAASNLGVHPSEAAVVEDATSGVAAGRNGAFGLVLGIARENNSGELLRNGADAVVEDLEYAPVEWIDNWFRRKPRHLFHFWDKPSSSGSGAKDIKINPLYNKSGKDAILNGKKTVFFFDYDGTLTPIVERPDMALLPDYMKSALEKLSEKHTTAVVSGRSRAEIERLVGINGILYAGDHGFDIKGENLTMIHPSVEKIVPIVKMLSEEIVENTKDIPGVIVEEKGFSVSVHYRLADKKAVPGVEKFVSDIVSRNKALRLMSGKKVFEIVPAVDWHKGKAIRWIVEALGLKWDESSIVFIGDDVTDENAFRMIRSRGTGILVSDEDRPSCASFYLKSPREVKDLIEKLI